MENDSKHHSSARKCVTAVQNVSNTVNILCKHEHKNLGKDNHRVILHDQISEFIKTTSWTMRLLFLQVSNIGISDISGQCDLKQNTAKVNKEKDD